MKNSSLGVWKDSIRAPGAGSALSGLSCRTRRRGWVSIGAMGAGLLVVGKLPGTSAVAVAFHRLEDVAVIHLAAVDVQGERGAVGQGIGEDVVLERRDQRAG